MVRPWNSESQRRAVRVALHVLYRSLCDNYGVWPPCAHKAATELYDRLRLAALKRDRSTYRRSYGGGGL